MWPSRTTSSRSSASYSPEVYLAGGRRAAGGRKKEREKSDPPATPTLTPRRSLSRT